MSPPTVYGLLAEFEDPTTLVHAARTAHDAGYRRMDAYTPFPVEELHEALGRRPTRLPWLVFAGGLIGCAGGYLMQYYTAAIYYPLNIGGRPLNSWPMFIPVTFEVTVLVASVTAVLAMLALNGLPRPHHPLFHSARFGLATRNRFFLCIEALDPKFDLEATRQFLAGLRPTGVEEVPL